MEQFLEITKVQTVVSYTRYAKNAEGERVLDFTQQKVFDGAMSMDDVLSEARGRCLPEYGITVVVKEEAPL